MSEETIPLKTLLKQARKKHGWPPGKGSGTRIPLEKIQKIQNLTPSTIKRQKTEGKQLKDIAEEIGVSPNYLSTQLTKKGIYWREL